MKFYIMLRQHLAAALLAIILFVPITVTTQTTEEPTNAESNQEEPISKSDKECFDTCLKNGYDESTCKGICYSEIKE